MEELLANPEALDRLVNLGTTTIVALVAIWALVQVRSDKKKINNNDNGSNLKDVMEGVKKELEIMNGNHLHAIQDCISVGSEKTIKTIRDGDDRVVNAINDGNLKIVQALGEIKGSIK